MSEVLEVPISTAVGAHPHRDIFVLARIAVEACAAAVYGDEVDTDAVADLEAP